MASEKFAYRLSCFIINASKTTENVINSSAAI